MVQLQNDLKALQATGTRVIGISPDSTEILKKFADEKGIQFTLLSDPGSQTIRKYDLIESRGLPHPGTLLIDKAGIVRAKLFQQGYRTRHTGEELIEAAKELP